MLFSSYLVCILYVFCNCSAFVLLFTHVYVYLTYHLIQPLISSFILVHEWTYSKHAYSPLFFYFLRGWYKVTHQYVFFFLFTRSIILICFYLFTLSHFIQYLTIQFSIIVLSEVLFSTSCFPLHIDHVIFVYFCFLILLAAILRSYLTFNNDSIHATIEIFTFTSLSLIFTWLFLLFNFT